jgi:ABC-type enterochelin transport system ATPase subunit
MSTQPLVGRDLQIRVLDDLLGRINESGGVPVVLGEAGIGKSALLAATRTRAADQGHIMTMLEAMHAEEHG